MAPFLLNPAARGDPPPRGLFAADEYAEVEAFFQSRPDLPPTPLGRLPALAARLSLGQVLIKDESGRFGLNAFKILGVTYAIERLAQGGRLDRIAAGPLDQIGAGPSDALRAKRLDGRATLACATAGNHGRAVARAARQRGLRARVYVPAGTARPRIDAIASEGAEVVVVTGGYEEAVRQAAADAARDGLTVVSDTSWPGYEEIPRWIMIGYTHLLEETAGRWGADGPPDVVLVQAGVGGLACAVASWFCHRFGAQRPFLICCEPAAAACVLESARAGRPVTLPGPLTTTMAGLKCAEVSPVAWPVLATAFDAYVAIDEERAATAVRTLARPSGADRPITAGPSGACGLGALAAILEDDGLGAVREASGLGPTSRVMVVNTEGATDPELQARILSA